MWLIFTTTTATLKQLRDRNPDVFLNTDIWLFDKPFANKRGKADQLQLRTPAVPDSFPSDLFEQQELDEGEFVLPVRDLVEGAISYYRETGRWLLLDCWVRCRDVSTSGYRVGVGFDLDGLYVGSYWSVGGESEIRLAVARKS